MFKDYVAYALEFTIQDTNANLSKFQLWGEMDGEGNKFMVWCMYPVAGEL